MLCDKTKKYVILKTEFILRRCKMNLREKLSDGLSKVKTYWKVPPLGNYMNYREILSLAGGGIGFKAVGALCYLHTRRFGVVPAYGAQGKHNR